jgi:hypothetical protein
MMGLWANALKNGGSDEAERTARAVYLKPPAPES